MTDELMQNVLSAVRTCDAADMPRILGMLAEISAVAQARLSAPAPAPATGQDVLLNVREAAAKLHCSTATLYKKDFPFTKRLGAKRLFSSRGIDEYLARQK
jgi:hypothetical protein